MGRTPGWMLGLLAFAGACVAACSAALLSLLQGNGLAASDLLAFAFYTLPFGLGVALFCVLASRFYSGAPFLGRHLLAFLAGPGLGTAYTVLVVRFLGPWAHSFSLPLWADWAVGGWVGVGCAVFAPGGWAPWFRHTALVFGVGLAAAGVGLPLVLEGMAQGQSTSLCVLKWNPNVSELKIGTLARQSLMPKGVEALQREGVKGLLVNWGGVADTEDASEPDSMAIVLVTKRPTREVELPQPDRCVIVYEQDGDNWKKLPGDAPTRRGNLVLAPGENPKTQTQFWIEEPGGDHQGGVLLGANDY
jgi:hypothetical protein